MLCGQGTVKSSSVKENAPTATVYDVTTQGAPGVPASWTPAPPESKPSGTLDQEPGNSLVPRTEIFNFPATFAYAFPSIDPSQSL